MPELPEVEVCRRNLERWTRGRRIASSEVADPRALRGIEPEDLPRAVVGRATGSVARRGKRITWRLEGGPDLCLHLGMTGKWVRREAAAEAPASTRLTLGLSDGSRLHYRDPRLLGRVEARDRAGGDAWLVEGLGPDAWLEAPDAAALRARVGSTRRPIKVALMDQRVLAGLGNIQAVEALWACGLRPDRAPASLSDAEWEALAGAIPATLERTIREEDGDEITYVEESPEANPFRVYGRAGQPCPRCGEPIRRDAHAGRGTSWCPGCQR